MARFDPWYAAIAAGVLAVAASLVYLAVVVADLGGDDTAAAPGDPTLPADGTDPTPTPDDDNDDDDAPEEVLYAGPVPERLLLDRMRPAGTGEDADLVFDSTEPTATVRAGWYVPVTALWTAVDSLAGDQLRGVMTGSITDWSSAGGLAGPAEYWAVEGSDAAAVAAEYAPGAAPARTFESVDALLEAMSPDSGALAIVPLKELTPAVNAAGIDGVDIARGFGDASAWPLVQDIGIQVTGERGESALAELRAQAPELPEVTRVVATGDYLPVRCSLARIEETGDWTSIFQTDLGDYLREADLALTSQDGSIQDFSEPYRCVDTVNLTSPPGAIDALEFAGIDGATVATNHIFDCGQTSGCGSRAFEQTLELLDEAGIKTAGGGMNLEEALEPAIFEVGDRTFGLLGFDDIAAGNPSFLGAEEDAPGTAPMDDSYDDEYAWDPNAAAFYAPAEMLETSRMEQTIREAKEQVDFLVVMINSGTEDSHNPGQFTNRSIKGLRAAAGAGADLVIGNQAHHVQAAEVRDGTFIGYALGNFVYDQVHSVEHTQCYLAEASFWEDRLAAMRLLPCQIHDYYQPRFVDEGTRLKILGDVWGAAAILPDTVE